MSRSERRALAEVEYAVGLGMSDAEAVYWRTQIQDPCGCAEGMVGGVVFAALGSVLGPGGLAVGALAGFVGGALGGKVFGVARGLRLPRWQRQELSRRVSELADRPSATLTRART